MIEFRPQIFSMFALQTLFFLKKKGGLAPLKFCKLVKGGQTTTAHFLRISHWLFSNAEIFPWNRRNIHLHRFRKQQLKSYLHQLKTRKVWSQTVCFFLTYIKGVFLQNRKKLWIFDVFFFGWTAFFGGFVWSSDCIFRTPVT